MRNNKYLILATSIWWLISCIAIYRINGVEDMITWIKISAIILIITLTLGFGVYLDIKNRERKNVSK